jgi:hypothetical protein
VADPVDVAIVALAGRQHGNVTRAQLLRLGLGRAAIAYRVRTGRLYRAHLGVFAVGRPPRTPLERAAAAVLACGAGAALSHESALTLWGFTQDWPTPWHVTAAGHRRRPGIETHRASGLIRADLRTQLGIRVTSPARTVLDCAPRLPDKRLVRIVADGRRSGKLRVSELSDVARRFRHHPGAACLAPVLEAPGAPTRSEFEEAFIAFCRRFGLPAPIVNTVVCGHEADALFAASGLIVELDGWDFHRDRHVFESDRDRDADTLAGGLATVRITWERLTQAPDREAARLRMILAGRSTPARGSARRT